MNGELSRFTYTKKKSFSNVLLQKGRVKLDSDWDEKTDVQVRAGLIMLDIWERGTAAVEDGSIAATALGAPDVDAREGSEVDDCELRLTREVGVGGVSSSTLQVRLGLGSVRPTRFPLPDLQVTVDGRPWSRVDSLSEAGLRDRVYVLDEDGDSSIVVFGDGIHGARPSSGSTVGATYRFGGGASSQRHFRRKKPTKL